jgi:aminoglycoside 3-N-acetyltransferase
MEESAVDMRIAAFLPADLKSKLRAWKGRAHSAYVNRFHAFTPDDLLEALRALGIEEGDVLIAHTSFKQFQGFQGGIGEAIAVLQKAVGENGALLIPTLPFTGSALQYVNSGRITNLAKTPSRMGLLTEIFRRLPNVTRSIHPTHPVAGWGRKAPALLENHYLARSPCGESSPFHRLLEADGKILLAGVGIRSMTFFHCVEEILQPAMPFSPLTQESFDLQTIGTDGNTYETHTHLFDPAVSARRDCELMIPALKQKGLWQERHTGLLRLTVLKARDVKNTLIEMASNGVYCYR